MGCGAWPFLVGGVPCRVNFDNERDFHYLFRRFIDILILHSITNTQLFVNVKEVEGNNRSVMPLEILGCTRATMVNQVGCSNVVAFGNLVKYAVFGIDPFNS